MTLVNLSLILSFSGIMALQTCARGPLEDIPVTENVRFSTHIQPITSTVCIKCHSQGHRDYSQFRNAYVNRMSIKQRVVIDRTMPLGEFLSDKDRALFRDWVNQGSKE